MNNIKKWISNCGRYTIQISEPAYDNVVDLSSLHFPNEIGTSLIGYYSVDGYEAFITELAPLTSDSVSKRAFFLRGIRGLKKFYKELFKNYNGERYYLGEWHSHPMGTNFPSCIDDQNQMNISFDKKTSCPESILLINAIDSQKNCDLGVYVYSRKNGKIRLYLDE